MARLRANGPAVLGLWALVLFPACVSKAPSTVVRTIERPPEIQSPWIGRSRQEVLKDWGRPWASEADGQGGTILLYERARKRAYDLPDDPTTPADDAPRNTEDDSFNRRVAAKFWVGADDTIYRVWIDERLWKKGFPLPDKPARNP